MKIKKRISLNMMKSCDGSIEDFLPKERGYRDVHFHKTMIYQYIYKKKYGKDV
jgi:hypothetical protein